MKNIKALIFILIFVVVFSVPVSANGQIQLGDHAYGVYSKDRSVLTVSGTGSAYIEGELVNSIIETVIIKDGITNFNFYISRMIKTIDLSDANCFDFNQTRIGLARAQELILPTELKKIDCSLTGRIQYITIFPCTEYIGNDVFFYNNNPNLTIRGYTGSYAETYADKHDIIFESIGHIDDYDGPKPEPVQAEVGETFTYKGLKYKVMSVGEGLYSSKSQVRLLGREKDSGVRISIPNTVLYKDQRFRVTSVYTKAFYKDTSLRGVTFGKWVNYIGSYSFYGCSRLSRISITGDSIFKSARESLTGIYGKCQVTVPKGKVASYRTALRKYGLPTSVKVMRA